MVWCSAMKDLVVWTYSITYTLGNSLTLEGMNIGEFGGFEGGVVRYSWIVLFGQSTYIKLQADNEMPGGIYVFRAVS